MAEPTRTVVNFKEDCVDPLAKLVMLEAMSFAVEKAESRLSALGKIFPGLETIGAPILQDIKDIRFSVENLNVCQISAPAGSSPLPPTEPLPKSVIKSFPKREQELIKAMPESLQTALAEELGRREGKAPIAKADFFVGGQGITATKEQKKAIEEPKKRTLPTAWGNLEYKGQTYSSPGAFLSGLHGGDLSKIRGKGNYLEQLDAEGFEVYIGGKQIDPAGLKKEDVEKLKGVGMMVKLKKGVIRPTPSGGEKTKAVPISGFPLPWVSVRDKEGTFKRFEDAKGNIIPEPAWRQFASDELDKMAPNEKTE